MKNVSIYSISIFALLAFSMHSHALPSPDILTLRAGPNAQASATYETVSSGLVNVRQNIDPGLCYKLVGDDVPLGAEYVSTLNFSAGILYVNGIQVSEAFITGSSFTGGFNATFGSSDSLFSYGVFESQCEWSK